MKKEDKRIKELYTEAIESIHASDEIRRKVIEMKDEKNTDTSKKGKVISMRKIIYIAAAAVLLIAGGMVVANANKGPYEQEETVKIIFNGEEKDAYFHDWNEDTVSWRFEVDDKEAWIYVTHTEPVDKNTTMYVTYNGEYIIASDEPEPTLNLYTDIDRSFAVIEEDSYSGQTSLIMTTDCGRQSMTLAADEEDGTKDGIINLGADTYEVYTVLSDGSIAQTSIHDHSSGMSEQLEYFAEKSVDNYTAADEENDNPYTIDDMPPTAE